MSCSLGTHWLQQQDEDVMFNTFFLVLKCLHTQGIDKEQQLMMPQLFVCVSRGLENWLLESGNW